MLLDTNERYVVRKMKKVCKNDFLVLIYYIPDKELGKEKPKHKPFSFLSSVVFENRDIVKWVCSLDYKEAVCFQSLKECEELIEEMKRRIVKHGYYRFSAVQLGLLDKEFLNGGKRESENRVKKTIYPYSGSIDSLFSVYILWKEKQDGGIPGFSVKE